MTRSERPIRPGSLFRPLPQYEPGTARRQRTQCPGQLALPLRAPRSTAGGKPRVPPSTGPQAPWPTDEALVGLIHALAEVTSGRRPLGPLRKHLSEQLCRELQSKPHPDLGHRFRVRRVLSNDSRAGALEVCAAVEDIATDRVIGAVACLEANWHGWRLTQFDFVLNQTARQRSAA